MTIRDSLAGELLTTFSARERKHFLLFLKRPERKSPIRVIQTAEWLLGPEREGEAQALYASLYPNRSFDRQRINQLLSDLYKLAKAFLTEQHFIGSEGIWLVAEFHRRKLEKHRNRHVRHLDKTLVRYRERFELEFQLHKISDRLNRRKSYNLQEMDRLLDLEYTTKKIRQACLMIAHENVIPIGYDYGLLPAVLAAVSDELMRNEPLIAAYYHAYQFTTNPEADGDFDRVRTLITNPTEQFSDYDLQILYFLCINYSIRQLNRGKLDRIDATLDLYQEGIRGGHLLENGELSGATFRNVIAIGLRGGHYEWVEQFMLNYQDKLPEAQRESLVYLSRARLAYARGALEEALLELRYVTTIDTLSNLTIVVMKAKIYYDLGELDLLNSFLESARILAWRKEKTYHRQAYRNFIALLLRIIHLSPGDDTSREKLRETIKQEKILPERSWLTSLIS